MRTIIVFGKYERNKSSTDVKYEWSSYLHVFLLQKRYLISIQLPIKILFLFRNSVPLYLLREKIKLCNRFNTYSKEQIHTDMGTWHRVIFLQGEGKEAIISELIKPHLLLFPLHITKLN
jgi:hypothetical protein